MRCFDLSFRGISSSPKRVWRMCRLSMRVLGFQLPTEVCLMDVPYSNLLCLFLWKGRSDEALLLWSVLHYSLPCCCGFLESSVDGYVVRRYKLLACGFTDCILVPGVWFLLSWGLGVFLERGHLSIVWLWWLDSFTVSVRWGVGTRVHSAVCGLSERKGSERKKHFKNKRVRGVVFHDCLIFAVLCGLFRCVTRQKKK